MNRIIVIKEKLSSKEKEIMGQWLTEEKLRKSTDYSNKAVASILAYCKRFPNTLVRRGCLCVVFLCVLVCFVFVLACWCSFAHCALV